MTDDRQKLIELLEEAQSLAHRLNDSSLYLIRMALMEIRDRQDGQSGKPS